MPGNQTKVKQGQIVHKTAMTSKGINLKNKMDRERGRCTEEEIKRKLECEKKQQRAMQTERRDKRARKT